MERRPVLLLYCQHSLGLGELARALHLAAGLAARFDVILANGGRFPAGTVVPAGMTVVNLPPLGHDAVNRLVSHDPTLTVPEARDRRRSLVVATLAATSPRVVLRLSGVSSTIRRLAALAGLAPTAAGWAGSAPRCGATEAQRRDQQAGAA